MDRAVTRRQVGAVVASAGAAAVLAACAAGGSQTAGNASKSRQPLTLQWQSSTASGDQTRQKNWDLLLDRFQERNPHVAGHDQLHRHPE